ncbi:unnamed protein product [Miscanthus lutarioriparius]|uniref:RHOMBOID-like protein n=1 Tax=Miscanthus lutarioriparius TaxID=422564 RepID=A0A811Q910_9POAL|nr:unnamed protein product [Miscanthus lutarioriparius]
MYVNDCPSHNSNCTAGFLGRFAFQPRRENPLLGPSYATLVKIGALDVPKVVHGRKGWCLITCMWLHAGVVHLLINILCLVIIGIRLEQEFGFVRIGVVYLISGFGGSLIIQSNVSVGASGALFGLIRSMLSELITNWSLYANKCSHCATILGSGGGAANAGAGDRGEPGAGAPPPGGQFRPHRRPQLLRGYNANEHCPWCHYLSCVPTKRWRCDASPTTCTGMQQENTLTVVCAGGKNQTYVVASSADATQGRINDLCNQLCT